MIAKLVVIVAALMSAFGASVAFPSTAMAADGYFDSIHEVSLHRDRLIVGFQMSGLASDQVVIGGGGEVTLEGTCNPPGGKDKPRALPPVTSPIYGSKVRLKGANKSGRAQPPYSVAGKIEFPIPTALLKCEGRLRVTRITYRRVYVTDDVSGNGSTTIEGERSFDN